MIMIAVLHEVLLMVILQMLLPLISNTNKDWFPLLLAYTKAKKLASRHYASKRITSRHLLSFVRFALQSKVPMSAITSSMLQNSKCNPILMPDILLLTRVGSLSKKKKGGFSMTTTFVIFPMLWSWFSTLCHAYSDTICYKDKNFGFYNSFPTFRGQKMKFTIHCYYSLSLFANTIHCYYSLLLFTPNFCLFKGGCPLYWNQVFCMLSSGLLP